jgi:hypothetical protein
MDSEQKTVPFDALVSDQSLREAWSARQLEIIADHLGTIAQCLNTSTYKLSDQFFERIAVALEGHCGK